MDLAWDDKNLWMLDARNKLLCIIEKTESGREDTDPLTARGQAVSSGGVMEFCGNGDIHHYYTIHAGDDELPMADRLRLLEEISSAMILV